uniref:cation:proton antiporter domain-containing protein n=1 Tax=Undibacterium luofuense TaxID=2828733 RepID=UPI0030EEDD7E
ALDTTLIYLLFAVVGVVGCRLLHLPAMLGYLVAGIFLAQGGALVEANEAAVASVAELGVVLLMFVIGLEFNLPKLMGMRRLVFGFGMAQVVLMLAGTLIGHFLFAKVLASFHLSWDLNWQGAVVLGSAMAMSSTAIVVKMMAERAELDTQHGRRVIGALLFQDLAVVPLLVLIPALGQMNESNVWVELSQALLKAAVLVGVLLWGGQKAMRVWLRVVDRRNSEELFMLNILLITLGLAWLTEHAGLSMAMGSFMAGMLIAETDYKHRVEEDIRPFHDVLLGLFFITVGMLLNLKLVFSNAGIVLFLFVVPLLLKFVLIAGLARLFGSTTSVALRTGLALAQAGEFGFVLLNQAGALSLIDKELLQLILASMVLSMLVSPFILAKSDAIVMKLSSNEWMMQSLALTQIAARTMSTRKHVIIAGFGRSGQNLARLLSEENIDYHALDLDPDRVREAQTGGANVSYGDAARRESLVAAGINRASALVITYTSTASALRILHFVNELNPSLPVIVRSHDDVDLEKLRAAGATEVVPELMEGSLMLASHALVLLGVPLRRVVHRVQAARDARYESLRGFFHGASDASDSPDAMQIRLHTVVLTERATAVGKTLAELALEDTEAEIHSMRRGSRRLELQAEQGLQAGDVIVLRGTSEAVARAELRLLK